MLVKEATDVENNVCTLVVDCFDGLVQDCGNSSVLAI